jgi:hypothetical protein
MQFGWVLSEPGARIVRSRIALEMRSEYEELPRSSFEFAGAHRSQFCIGGLSIEVAGNSCADVSLVPPLEPFRSEAVASDIQITVEWVQRLDPISGRRVFDSGTTWRLYERETGFQFDFNAPLFGVPPYKRLLVDRCFRRATLQMSEESLAAGGYAADPLGYPLDELLVMHRLTQEKAIELHSCGIVRPDGTGNLFVGHSGAGKSTTTRLWTECEDVEVLSDDRIIVRRDELVETPFEAAGCPDGGGVLRLRDRSASPTSHFAQDDRAEKQVPPRRFAPDRNDNEKKQVPHPRFARVRNDNGKMRMYGTPWHGEAMYASPGSAPLTRIFVLEHGLGNVITRLSPSQAVAELFARSFVPFHRHEYVESALEFLQELVDAVPCYHFAFEPDQRAINTIQNFHD